MRKKVEVDIIIGVLVLLIIIGAGGVFYHSYEGLTWINAFYFTITTVMTIGFGDFAPTTDAGKIFTAIFAVVSVPTALFFLGIIIKDYFEGKINAVEDRVRKVLEEERRNSKL